jgi:hypothetical protein
MGMGLRRLFSITPPVKEKDPSSFSKSAMPATKVLEPSPQRYQTSIKRTTGHDFQSEKMPHGGDDRRLPRAPRAGTRDEPPQKEPG